MRENEQMRKLYFQSDRIRGNEPLSKLYFQRDRMRENEQTILEFIEFERMRENEQTMFSKDEELGTYVHLTNSTATLSFPLLQTCNITLIQV